MQRRGRQCKFELQKCGKKCNKNDFSAKCEVLQISLQSSSQRRRGVYVTRCQLPLIVKCCQSGMCCQRHCKARREKQSEGEREREGRDREGRAGVSRKTTACVACIKQAAAAARTNITQPNCFGAARMREQQVSG